MVAAASSLDASTMNLSKENILPLLQTQNRMLEGLPEGDDRDFVTLDLLKKKKERRALNIGTELLFGEHIILQLEVGVAKCSGQGMLAFTRRAAVHVCSGNGECLCL